MVSKSSSTGLNIDFILKILLGIDFQDEFEPLQELIEFY